MNKADFMCGNYTFRTYHDWTTLAYEYPNFPKKELYRVLLDKEISEENQKARGFVGKNCNNIKQFKEYAFKNGHPQSRNSLAYKLDTPLHILEELVKDSDAKIRATLANNPNLPLHCLLKLAEDSDVNVKKVLVSDKYRENTPIKILEILKNDESEEIRVLVASNKSTTSDILSYLANDTSLKVKNKVASNPNTSAETLEILWRSNNIFDEKNHNIPSHIVAEKITNTRNSETLYKIIERGLGTYPQVPAQTLEKLSLHKSSIVRCCVAEHPNTPIHILETLVTDDYSVTRWNLASNPNTPPHVLEYLLNNWEYCDDKYDNELCRRLAENRNTPVNTLEKLSQSISYQVLKAVSRNPSSPLNILENFAQRDLLKKKKILIYDCVDSSESEERFLYYYLSHNPRLTPEILGILANDISPDVRINLISHQNITTEIQTKLANDESPQVRKAVAGYRKSPITILELLTADESPDVRQALAKNLKTSSSILETLALDISPNVRKNVAENHNTPATVLEQLAQDEIKTISFGVIDNPNTPLKIKQTLQYRLRVKISPTLKGLTRLYKPEDDLSTLLSEYVKSQTPFVRFISLIHPLIPIEFLQQHSQSLLWWERYAVAINSATPIKIREILTENCNCIVKAAAQDNL